MYASRNSVKSHKTHICSITGKRYEGFGNNAYPFSGRCSDWSNTYYVIPARLMGITPELIKEWGKKTVMRVIDHYHNQGKFNF